MVFSISIRTERYFVRDRTTSHSALEIGTCLLLFKSVYVGGEEKGGLSYFDTGANSRILKKRVFMENRKHLHTVINNSPFSSSPSS